MTAKKLYAMTLVGGRGERLKPLTDDIPKPMVPVNGVPLLEHHVRMFLREGVTDIVFLCGYKGEKVREHFGDGSDFGFNAHYNMEPAPLGRGGAFRAGLNMLPPDAGSVIASNGDIFTDQPLRPIFELHNKLEVQATAMLVPYPNQYGVVETDRDGRVVVFAEKRPLSQHINAGLYIFQRELAGRLPPEGDHETSTFPELAKLGLLAGFRSDRLWISVETMKDLREAEAKLGMLAWLGG